MKGCWTLSNTLAALIEIFRLFSLHPINVAYSTA